MRILILLLFPLFSYSQLSIGILESSRLDADAQAFISAAAITNGTQIFAINTLVVGLKADGLWTKMKAIYPFVGGTASTHKYNLKDPRDLDAAFRLLFVGGWTHSSTGATPSTGYAETYCVPSTNLISNNQHFSFYSRTNNTTPALCDFGVQDDQGGISRQFYLFYYIVGTTSVGSLQNVDGRRADYTSETNSLGLILTSRTSSTSLKLYRNADLKATQTLSSATRPDISPVIGAFKYRNLSVISYTNYSNRQCAFATIGDGLTDTEAANLYNRIQAYQTTLSRQL